MRANWLSEDDLSFWLTLVYEPNGMSLSKDFLWEFFDISIVVTLKWCEIGDFNMISG